MPTPWFLPQSISQFAEDSHHISWSIDDNGSALKNIDGKYIKTVKDLLHIANPSVNDLTMKTWYLLLKNFNFQNLNSGYTGIEIELSARRGGRITDETIQLWYDTAAIGVNKADDQLDMIKKYGGENDIWNLDSLPSLDNNFGIVLRFQSHPHFPHKESPMIDYVKLRLW